MTGERSPGRAARLVAGVLICTSLDAGAGPAKRLAVLEFGGTGLDEEGRRYVSRVVRGEALKHLPDGWQVMDRQNMLVLLEAHAGACLREGRCDVETFQNIGADLGVSGEVVRLGGKLRLAMSLYDSESGTLRRSARAEAASVDGLIAALPRACARLFRGGGPVPPPKPVEAEQEGPAPPPAWAPTPAFTADPVTAALGLLRVEGSPRGARVEVEGPNDYGQAFGLPGMLEGLAPGTYRVAVSAAGYQAQEAEARVEPDSLAKVTVNLELLGRLAVSGEPRGARADVTGPGGYEKAYKLPHTLTGLVPGTYRVRVTAEGYLPREARAAVSAGEEAKVAVTLLPPGTLIVVGEPAGAAVEVRGPDGATLGRGGLPATVRGLAPGRYGVVVERDGYARHESSHQVAAGRKTRVRVALERGGGAQTGKAGIEWVEIAGGTFSMGSSSGGSDEKPVHRVRVPSFQLARTEVTVAQYREFVKAKGWREPTTCAWGKPNYGVAGRDDHPVNCVSWKDARAFAAWVSPGGRLPTEAEWEYAARSGGLDRPYPWGDEKASCARAVMDDGGNGCGRGDTTWPVCGKPKGNSAQGLCDLAGNVWEWVEDVYHDSYRGAPADGKAWGGTGGYRVFRGGSWVNTAGFLRASSRLGNAPGYRYSYLGFRPARSIP